MNHISHTDYITLMHSGGGGVDLFECDIVRIQLVTKRKNGKRRGKKSENYFCGRRMDCGKEGREYGDDISRVCHERQHSVPQTGPSNKTPQEIRLIRDPQSVLESLGKVQKIRR